MQTFQTAYNHAYSGRLRGVVDELPPMPFSDRKIIARRAAMELPINGVVNLGIGMPEGVGAVANEEEIIDKITLTTEAGVLGGVPQSSLDFGAAINANAVIQTNQQFDFYDGGGLDLAVLGMAEVDRQGNVNVSRFKDRFAGAGGFINISQNARKLIFVGTFKAKGLNIECADGKMKIAREGAMMKFIDQVEQVTYNGRYGAEQGRTVLYVTERCVFRLTPEGLELAEVAPGLDIQKDIIDQMAFEPIVTAPKLMDAALFFPEPMKLKDCLLNLRMEDRLTYDAETNTVFINLSGVELNTEQQFEKHAAYMNEFFAGLGKKVNIISNYDGRTIAPKLQARHLDFITELERKYYLTAARYTTSAFLRQKMGHDLKNREIAPHIFETAQEARAYIAEHGGGA
jgi:propionate CoA-transferase